MKIDYIRFLKVIQENQICTSNYLSTYFSVSSRTIKNYVKEINQLFPDIIQSTSRGYVLTKTNFADLTDSLPPQSSEERISYILNGLLELVPDQYLNLFDLCDELYVSYSTLKNEITKLKNKIADYDLKIITKNDSIAILGSETEKRKLISDLLYQESARGFMNYSIIQNKFPAIDITFIQMIFMDAFREHHYFINDYSLISLVLHAAISIDRILNTNYNSEVIVKTEAINAHIYTLTEEIVQEFEKHFSIHFVDAEIYELALLILSRTTSIDYASINESNISKYIRQEYLELAKDLLNNIQSIYLTDLSQEQMLNNFALHLQNLFIRSNNHSLNKNPLTTSIKTSYPFLFDIAVNMSASIRKKTGLVLNDDEISFIAIHLGCMIVEKNTISRKISVALFCPHYYETVQNLTKQINDSFYSDLNILSVITNENQIEDLKDIDLIISILPLTRQIAIPHLEVGLFINAQDIEKIKSTIHQLKHKKQQNDFEKHLRLLLLPSFFKKEMEFSSSHQCIAYLCKNLTDQGYADDNLYQEIIERENISSTAYGTFAIPHSIRMESEKTILSVLIPKKPIPWDGHPVSLVMMICINKNDRKIFQYIYETISAVLIEKKNVELLSKCNSYEQFIKTFVGFV